MKIRVCTNARHGYGARIGRKPVQVIGSETTVSIGGARLSGLIYRNKMGGISLAKSWVKERA